MRRNLIYFAFFLAILLFVFRSLIFNISSHLIDWYDYPLAVWIVSQNVDKFVLFNFKELFNTNFLYPFSNTLLLTETFFAQSILALPARFLTTNPILIFNFVFLITFVLNFVAANIFWKVVFKKNNLAFLGALLTIFSPFFHIELSHFQLQSYWPALIALYFILKSEYENQNKNLALAGFFISIQFLASVYLAVFLLTAVVIYFISRFLIYRKVLFEVKRFILVFLVFLSLSWPLILGYLSTKQMFGVERPYEEFVVYSAHLSDYFFSGSIKSFIHGIDIFKKWNSFNHHWASLFSGFFLTIFGFLGLANLKIKKKKINLNISLSSMDLFFLFLILAGFVFSLGPRAGFNGNYAEIPLPYHFVVKYLPFFDVIRAPSRWVFIFYPGLIYFSLKFLSKQNLNNLKFSILALIVLLEYVPIGVKSYSQIYLYPKDDFLREVCREEKKVVLEVPVTHFDAGKDIFEGLSYITRTILASNYHKCYLINGYTSYDLPSVGGLKNSLYEASLKNDLTRFASLLKSSKANFLVVNSADLKEEVKADFLIMIDKLVKTGYLSENVNGVYEIRIPD